MKKIDQKILAVLSACSIEGNVLKLNSGQLDRWTYTAVNKVLEEMGGKWNRKQCGHIFDKDPTDRLESVLLTGEIVSPKNFGYFPTPQDLACRVVDLAEIQPGELVLEPEAGQGGLADEIARRFGKESLHCVELLENNLTVLAAKGYATMAGDFLQVEPRPVYGRVIMNPPFERQQDIDHVLHAFKFLRPGGRVVAIMSAGIVFRSNKKTTDFRKLVDTLGYYEENPEGSFKPSGTGVSTITVVLNKPNAEEDEVSAEVSDGPPVVGEDQLDLFPWYGHRQVA